jgi:transcriptional regulator with XRE-family HTH domain
MRDPTIVTLTARPPEARSHAPDTPRDDGTDADILIGPNLRRLRSDRGLSLDGLAKVAGVSRAMLSQIERGASAPTINIVWKLARAFNVPFSVLIAGADTQMVRSLPINETKTLVSATGGLSSRALFPTDSTPKVEFYEIRLKAGSSEESAPHPDGTIENLVVSSGRVEVEVAGNGYVLETGDAIVFPGDQMHAYRNPSDRDALLYLVMTYP